MKFYKITKEDKIISLEARPMASTDSNMIEIQEEEYNSLLLEFAEKAEAEEQAQADDNETIKEEADG